MVKVNVPEVLRAELARPSWKGERVALGTNTDPYQWVEGRYKLMRGIWEALRDFRNPCSILTKSPLVLRDLDLLKEIAAVTEISACLSVPTLDAKAWRATEPGTPNPKARLEAVAELNRSGIPTGVLIAPLMPGINDAPEQVERIVEAATEADATYIGGQTLFLRGSTREVFFEFLREKRPDLVERYERLYAKGAYLSPAERRKIEVGADAPWVRRGLSGRRVPRRAARVPARRGSPRPRCRRRKTVSRRRCSDCVRVTAVTDLKPGAVGSVASVVPRLSRPHVAPMARSLTHQTAQRARRAKWELAGLIPLFALTIVAYVERERIFGVDTPVRVAAAVVMVMLGWALARDLGRFTAPALFRRMDPATAGTAGFLIRLVFIVVAAIVSLRVAGLNPATLALGGAITAVVLGLAAQQTLGNVFAGIVLIAVRPFKVGDRVRLQAGGLAGPDRGRRVLARPALHDLRPGRRLGDGAQQRRPLGRGRAAARAGFGGPSRAPAPRRQAERRPGDARAARSAPRCAASRRSRSRRSTPTRSSSASRRRRWPTPTARAWPTRCSPRSAPPPTKTRRN